MQAHYLRDIKAFHEKFSLEYNGKPRILPVELFHFRKAFMQEELNEWSLAQAAHHNQEGSYGANLEDQLDALVDLMYVLLGTVYLQGFMPIYEEAWNRVHTANMAKIRAERPEQSKRGRPEFDVVKPDGWQPPSHTDLVTEHENGN